MYYKMISRHYIDIFFVELSFFSPKFPSPDWLILHPECQYTKDILTLALGWSPFLQLLAKGYFCQKSRVCGILAQNQPI